MKLIIFHRHTGDAHNSGTKQILAALAVKYWIITAREVIREVENGCYEYRKRKRKSAQQVIALPIVRGKIQSRASVYSAVTVEAHLPPFKEGV